MQNFVDDSRDLHTSLDASINLLLTVTDAHGSMSLESIPWCNESLAAQEYTKIVDYRLDAYYKTLAEIGDVTDDMSVGKRAYAAIDLCQKLERLHPLRDGNCRIFCTILLAKLLVQQRQALTLVDDPNKLDGLSRREVFGLVQQGQVLVNTWRIAGPERNTLPPLADEELKRLEAWLYPPVEVAEVDDEEESYTQYAPSRPATPPWKTKVLTHPCGTPEA